MTGRRRAETLEETKKGVTLEGRRKEERLFGRLRGEIWLRQGSGWDVGPMVEGRGGKLEGIEAG